MEYCIYRHYPKDSVSRKQSIAYYTFSVLEHLAKLNGHKLVEPEDINANTVILISITTLDGIPFLKRIREKYENNIIISGGHFAYHTPTMLVFSDYVNVGQAFDFFKAHSIKEIEQLDSIIKRGDNEKKAIPSELIEWENVPIALDSKNHYYYWGGVGCKNKCAFCFTSWTNKHQQNDEKRIISATKYAKLKHKTITITSNEYEYEAGAAVQDMMLRDYLNTKFKRGGRPKLIRLGIEFATNETRKRMGKQFTDEEFYEAIHKAQIENKELNLFFIAGLEPLENMEHLLMGVKHNGQSPKIFIKVTNLVYTQFTPLFKKRFDLKLEYYADKYFRENMLRINGYTQRYRYLTIARPKFAMYNTAMGCVTNEDEYNTARKIHNADTSKEAYDILMDSGIMNNDFSDKIIFPYQKKKLEAYLKNKQNGHR